MGEDRGTVEMGLVCERSDCLIDSIMRLCYMYGLYTYLPAFLSVKLWTVIGKE